MTLTPSARTLALGERTQLSARVERPSGAVDTRAVDWAASDPNVAVVSDSGLVTSIGLGTAEISGTAGGAADTARITVTVAPAPGEPLHDLTASQLQAFAAGRALFERVFAAADGLGPLFNGAGCVTCHETPAAGGSAPVSVTHASRGSGGACDELKGEGGFTYQQFFTQALIDTLGAPPEPIPAGANVATRTSPDVFGFGLLDAIDDSTIVALEDPDDDDRDGISGRANRTAAGALGRFGRKAHAADLSSFVSGAFRDELGITTPDFPDEGTVGGTPIPAAVDPLPEPELSAADVAAALSFVRLLAPPASPVLDSAALAGQAVFRQIGCDRCHVESFTTGASAVEALAGREVRAYSDFLLHDMGAALADICLAQVAGPAEFRTEPLMGLGMVESFLHDGRAMTIEEAITLHGGEGSFSRNAFLDLSAGERATLLEFLASL